VKLRIKLENRPHGPPEIQAGRNGRPPDVPPQQWWDDLIAGHPDTLVIDTRKTPTEVTLGSFDGAIDPATASSADFPDPGAEERDLHRF